MGAKLRNFTKYPVIKRVDELNYGDTFYSRIDGHNRCYMVLDMDNLALKQQRPADGHIPCLCLDLLSLDSFHPETEVSLISVDICIYPFTYENTDTQVCSYPNEQPRLRVSAPRIISSDSLFDNMFILHRPMINPDRVILYLKIGELFIDMETGEVLKLKFPKDTDLYKVDVYMRATETPEEEDKPMFCDLSVC